MGMHCKMNHLLFPAMIHLAEHKRINKNIDCQFACHAFLVHPIENHGTQKALMAQFVKKAMTHQEKCIWSISMDQMVSAQPGLILQMAGFLTNLCVWGGTIFVDHFSQIMCMWLSCMTLLLMRLFLLSFLLKDMQTMEELISIHIESIMVALLTLVFDKQSKRQIKLLLSAQLGHIIKMGLSKDESKSLD
jgi:hypothetical protein